MKKILVSLLLLFFSQQLYSYEILEIKNSEGDIMKKIHPFLWFDNQAEEAAEFYVSLFANSRLGNITHYIKEGQEIHGRPEGSVMTVDFELAGQKFVTLNGGPHFKINPSVSFFVILETDAEVEKLWKNLSDGGIVMMPLDKYDWSEKYGWVQDKFGMSWQISLGRLEDVGQVITPAFLFVGKQHGRAEEAINFYTSIFPNSNITGILKYGPGESAPEGTVKHAQFSLDGNVFMIMENSFEHPFAINEAISFVVTCKDQDEVDYYWDKLTEGGEESQCGWLKDKFGVSWQIVPMILMEMLSDPDKEKVSRVTNAFLQMKKFDILKLQEVYNEN